MWAHLIGANLKFAAGLDHPAFLLAPMRRRWRVGWLRYARLMAVSSGVAAIVAARERLAELGTALLTRGGGVFDWLPFVDDFASSGQQSVATNMATASQLPTFSGALVVVAPFALLYAVVSVVWQHWDRNEQRRLHTRRGYRLWPPQAVIMMWAAPLECRAGASAGGYVLCAHRLVAGLATGSSILSALYGHGERVDDSHCRDNRAVVDASRRHPSESLAHHHGRGGRDLRTRRSDCNRGLSRRPARGPVGFNDCVRCPIYGRSGSPSVLVECQRAAFPAPAARLGMDWLTRPCRGSNSEQRG